MEALTLTRRLLTVALVALLSVSLLVAVSPAAEAKAKKPANWVRVSATPTSVSPGEKVLFKIKLGGKRARTVRLQANFDGEWLTVYGMPGVIGDVGFKLHPKYTYDYRVKLNKITYKSKGKKKVIPSVTSNVITVHVPESEIVDMDGGEPDFTGDEDDVLPLVEGD